MAVVVTKGGRLTECLCPWGQRCKASARPRHFYLIFAAPGFLPSVQGWIAGGFNPAIHPCTEAASAGHFSCWPAASFGRFKIADCLPMLPPPEQATHFRASLWPRYHHDRISTPQPLAHVRCADDGSGLNPSVYAGLWVLCAVGVFPRCDVLLSFYVLLVS